MVNSHFLKHKSLMKITSKLIIQMNKRSCISLFYFRLDERLIEIHKRSPRKDTVYKFDLYK